MTDQQWAIIEPLVVKKRAGAGRPASLDLRAGVKALLYVLRTGCQWAYWPHEFPDFNRGYDPFSHVVLGREGEAINTALREQVRVQAGREAQPSLALIDSQSVKTTEVGGAQGFDGAKNVKGRQRRSLVATYQNSSGCERSFHSSSGQASSALSSMSIAAPNCGQVLALQAASMSRSSHRLIERPDFRLSFPAFKDSLYDNDPLFFQVANQMLHQTSLLVMLVSMVDRIPIPPAPSKRPRGRPNTYSDRLILN